MSSSQTPFTKSDMSNMQQGTEKKRHNEVTPGETRFASNQSPAASSQVPTWHASSSASYAPFYALISSNPTAYTTSTGTYVTTSTSSSASLGQATPNSNALNGSDDFDNYSFRELLQAELRAFNEDSIATEQADVEQAPAEQTPTETTQAHFPAPPPPTTVLSTQPAISNPQTDREAEIHPDSDPEKPYSCDYCGKRYRTLFSKRRHERCNHADEILQQQPEPETKATTNSATERPFSCGLCGRRFRESRARELHKRVFHPGTASNSDAQQATDRPHTCDYCGKHFKALYNKKRHERENHTNVRSFECHICQKTFKRTDAFKTHMRVAHKIEPPDVRRRYGPSAPIAALSQQQQQAQEELDEWQRHAESEQGASHPSR